MYNLTDITYLLPRIATTPYEAPKPKFKSESDSPVNVHLYRSMIGSLMYLTASRLDIMFAVSACSRHQVTPTSSNLEAVNKIFKYLKGQPKLGLWYPKESPLVLEAYSDSDYAGENRDRKSTTGGCQFLADDGGVTDLPIPKIYSGMDALGYVSEGSWDQFGSPIAIALICLSGGRRFNWSNYIFRGMVNNIGNAKKFLIKLFANMRLNFAGNHMPLLPAMLLQAQAGEGAEVAVQDVPHPVPAPDQSLPYLTTPSRPQSPDPVALVLGHDHSSTQPETAAGSFPSMEDVPLGGDFHTSPLRSSHTPSTGQPSGGAKDPITLTALSSLVSTLVQKTKKRKMVVSDSDEEDGTTPSVDLDALRALANAAVAVDSDVHPGSTSQIPTTSLDAPTDVPAATFTTPAVAFDIAPGASFVAPSASSVAPGASSLAPGDSVTPTDVSAVSADSPNVPVGPSNKGKSPMVKEDIPVPARTFRQREEDRLGEEAARRLHEEEMAEIEKERAEAHRKRQQEVLESAKFYNEDDWLNIQAQVEANASLLKTLLGDDVLEDNFPARMDALIKKKRQALAEKLFKERGNGLFCLAKSTFVGYSKLAVVHTFKYSCSGNSFWVFNSPMLHLLRVEVVINSPWIMPILGIQELASPNANGFCPDQTATDKDVSNPFMAVMVCQKSFGYSNSPLIHVLRIRLVIIPPGYVVPTSRVIVPAGRYIAPTGSVIAATGRYIVPAGKYNS
nr:putative ribonuclease H-like domain-containing protein [Tanacetum cinerariifolium]